MEIVVGNTFYGEFVAKKMMNIWRNDVFDKRKNTVYIVRIENIPTRYPNQMLDCIVQEMERKGIEHNIIGHNNPIETPKSMFLPFIPSTIYKSEQINELAKLFYNDTFERGDIIFFMDAWHPGVISCRQMIEFYQKEVYLHGFWHAGSYDPSDLLGQSCQEYFLNFEKGVADCLDMNYFATSFSKKLFQQSYPINHCNISGFPLKSDYMKANYVPWNKKKNYILFPHRKSSEKHPEYFEMLKDMVQPEFKCIFTLDETTSKEEYHKLLSEAKYSVSFAEQETFGIAMAESLMAGCYIIVPDHKSYSSLYNFQPFTYDPKSLKSSFSACKAVYNKILSAEDGAVEGNNDTIRYGMDQLDSFLGATRLVSIMMGNLKLDPQR